MKYPSFQKFGAHTLLITWESVINEDVHSKVVNFNQFLSTTFAEAIRETVITYQSLAVYLAEAVDVNEFLERLQMAYKTYESTKLNVKISLVHIPVCYEGEYAPDIEEVSKYNNITVSDVIERHSKAAYKAYFIGFLPGFPYLGGLHSTLHTPRKQTPRSRVSRGSVGIGGAQTGIYTMDSPGGWNIIGRSPLLFFDPAQTPPVIIEAGDYVRFNPITKEEFLHIRFLIEKDIYLLQKEPYHD